MGGSYDPMDKVLLEGGPYSSYGPYGPYIILSSASSTY
jgi:hypothetical protein